LSDRIIAIISTSEVGKARTGTMYAINALKHGWLEDVKLFFFGPAEKLLLKDAELQRMLKEYQLMEESAVACKFIADGDGTSQGIAALGVRVEFVGRLISDLIKDGYTPMVW
jgi:hypothetical protein